MIVGTALLLLPLVYVRLNSGMPVAHAVVGDAGGDDFILDTGAAFSYVVFQRFARAHPESFETPGDGAVLYGSGIGGPMSYRKIPSRKIALGTWSFDDELGVEAVSANALGFDNEDGLIGADILKLFTLYLDYGADRVYLAPNGRATMFEAASAARVPEAQHTAAGVAPSRAAPVPLQVRNRLH